MIKDKLKEIRENNNMNKKEFASYIGIKYTTYNGYETGAREPDSDFLILISKKFDVSIDYILGLQDEKEILHSYELKSSEYEHIKKYRSLDPYGQETINLVLDREAKRAETLLVRESSATEEDEISSPLYIISYYQHLASAGSGEYLFDDIPTETIEVPANDLSEQADFVIGVTGNSMEPTYYDGDMVYVEKMEEIPVGSIGIFTRGPECFIKELGNDRLISHNKNYPDILASDDIRCVGLVLGKVEE
ncbi:XRE family transcriptional regulator [Lacrimispora sp.]|uniref:XRE family transcriptional regulator n=1 Tax=Lacrimispora sp. TaxID=2719234 RepID=UPI003460A2C3